MGRVMIAIWLVTIGGLVWFGSGMAWKAYHGFERKAEHLRKSGVEVGGKLVHCDRPANYQERGNCRFSIDYKGFQRTWNYGDKGSEFTGVKDGRSVAMLLDPTHPSTAFTVYDVEHTGTAWRIAIIFGIFVALFGLALLVMPILADYI